MVYRKNQTNVSVRKQTRIRDVFSNDNNHPFSVMYEQGRHLLISGGYSRCMDMRVFQIGTAVSFAWGVQMGLCSPLTQGFQ